MKKEKGVKEEKAQTRVAAEKIERNLISAQSVTEMGEEMLFAFRIIEKASEMAENNVNQMKLATSLMSDISNVSGHEFSQKYFAAIGNAIMETAASEGERMKNILTKTVITIPKLDAL